MAHDMMASDTDAIFAQELEDPLLLQPSFQSLRMTRARKNTSQRMPPRRSARLCARQLELPAAGDDAPLLDRKQLVSLGPPVVMEEFLMEVNPNYGIITNKSVLKSITCL
ncbi:unnamed protein product [Protopolystoma xenopodis]|uniref:Uncharacterized protein n=1 Tax=Protopolystoma xenopodis TaxID=117903 RepID=A0A3S5A1D6_9PLAT|nr:unnamed protein product [Protopolystoma xenopodis]